MSSALRSLPLLVVLTAVSLASPALAEQVVEPVYQRGRAQVRQASFPGYGGGGFYGGGFYGGRGYGGGFFPWNPFFFPPTIVGSWYQRPYPYHFDYYRWRYSMPPVQPGLPGPCVEVSPGEPSEVGAY